MTPGELRLWRQDLGWSQERAARELGVSLRTYKYFESGVSSGGLEHREVPRYVELAARELTRLAAGGSSA